MKQLKSLVLVVSLLFSSVSNAALMLWFDPDFQIASTGDSVSVKLMASGLGDNAPLSLAGFDLDVLFDPTALSFTGYTMFDGLGDIGLFEAADFSIGEYAPGFIGLAEESFLTEAELNTGQSGSFALAELFFDVDLLEVPDFTILSIDGISFSDAAGRAITDFETRDGIIATVPRTIPEPSALILIALGLLMMASRRIKK